MSKRVSNSRSNRTPHKLRARQRVSYGWRVQKRLDFAFEMERRRRMAEAGVVEVAA